MALKFNPPPGWPPPPEGWVPPRGWKPEKSWPPAPPGWRFWVDDSAPPMVRTVSPGPAPVRLAQQREAIVKQPGPMLGTTRSKIVAAVVGVAAIWVAGIAIGGDAESSTAVLEPSVVAPSAIATPDLSATTDAVPQTTMPGAGAASGAPQSEKSTEPVGEPTPEPTEDSEQFPSLLHMPVAKALEVARGTGLDQDAIAIWDDDSQDLLDADRAWDGNWFVVAQEINPDDGDLELTVEQADDESAALKYPAKPKKAKLKTVPRLKEYRTGAECHDGSYSSATGRGACSHHGGVRTWLTEGNEEQIEEIKASNKKALRRYDEAMAKYSKDRKAVDAARLLAKKYPCEDGPYEKGHKAYSAWRDTNDNGIACDFNWYAAG